MNNKICTQKSSLKECKERFNEEIAKFSSQLLLAKESIGEEIKYQNFLLEILTKIFERPVYVDPKNDLLSTAHRFCVSLSNYIQLPDNIDKISIESSLSAFEKRQTLDEYFKSVTPKIKKLSEDFSNKVIADLNKLLTDYSFYIVSVDVDYQTLLGKLDTIDFLISISIDFE